MKEKLSERLTHPFKRVWADVPWFGPTLSTVLIASLINVLTNSLNEWGGVGLSWVFVLLLFVLTVIFVAAYNQSYKKSRVVLGPIADIRKPRRHKGLIYLLGNDKPLREALDYHLPVLQHCWLVVTPEMQDEAGSIMARFTDVRFSVVSIKHLYDTQSCHDAVKRICTSDAKDIGISPTQIIADITGGTKPMTTGMIIACINSKIAIEHVPAKYDSTGKPIGTLPPIQIRIQ